MTLIAREVYALLLHRTALSQRNGWTDEKGNVYIVYPVEELAADIGGSKRTVLRALGNLQQADLIDRKRAGFNMANRIFLKMPPVHK